MYQGWHDLYLVLGPASAGLIGLLFVVVTLTAGSERQRAMRGAQVYMTPIVFHLGVLVLLAAFALFPNQSALPMGAATVICGMLGLTYASYVCRALMSKTMNTFVSDLWCYGFLVAALYVGMIVSGLLIVAGLTPGPYALAVDQIALYLLMVNNAWDLVLYITPRRDDPPPDEAGA
jgi:hypothetical protein